MLKQLDLFFSLTPLEGPEQMALDDVLLAQLTKPLLRVYAWKSPCVTFGYFQKWSRVAATFPSELLVRRATGGGCVQHGDDLTFSLMLPTSEPLTTIRPLLFYKQLHEAVVAAIENCFQKRAHLAKPDDVMKGEHCFTAPALHDLLFNKQKILGGAQRRSFGKLLYQGSLSLLSLGTALSREGFFQSLAALLAQDVVIIEEDPQWLKEATTLAAIRYRSVSWSKKR